MSDLIGSLNLLASVLGWIIMLLFALFWAAMGLGWAFDRVSYAAIEAHYRVKRDRAAKPKANGQGRSDGGECSGTINPKETP